MAKFYRVGGCVRDALLGLEPKDIDYVVVGGTPEEMVEQGYVQVGADFPVFLHPSTSEEYALARIERKAGVGYHGFETQYENLNPELLKKFEELGYRADDEFTIEELMGVFQHINQLS